MFHPERSFLCSALAQRVNKATYDDFKEAVKLHRSFLDEVEAERCHLYYPPMKGKPYVLSAWLGNQDEGRSQLGGIHFLPMV